MVQFRDIIRIEKKNRHRIPCTKNDIQTEKLWISDSQIMEKMDTKGTFDLPAAHMGSEDIGANRIGLFEKATNFKDRELFSPVDKTEIEQEADISEAKELDEAYKKAAEIFEVSILVDPGKYRLGLGGAALSLLSQWRPASTIRAFVRQANDASKALFQAAGYVEDGQEWYILKPDLEHEKTT